MEIHAGVSRQVNHLVFVFNGSSQPYVIYNWGWDASTGVLVSFQSSVFYSSSAGSFNGSSLSFLTSTNLWSTGPLQFTIFPGSSNVTVNAGSSMTDNIYVISVNDTSGTVSLSVSVSPSGPSLTLSQPTVVLSPGGNASSVLTIITSASTLAQSYAVSITGTSGTASHTAKISLNVKPANSPDFSISANPLFLHVPVLMHGNYTITIASLNGFDGTVVLGVSTDGATVSLQPPSITGSGVAMLRAIATTPGNYSVEVIATSSYLYHTVGVILDVGPSSQNGGSGTLSIDGSSGVGCPNTTSSCSATLTTQHPDDVIIAFATETLDLQTSCIFTISDTGSLSWTARSKTVFSLDGREQLQEFWARSVSPLSSDTITESISGCGNNYNNLMVFGISGANFNIPFDPNIALPGTSAGYGGGTSVQVSTSNPNDIIFAAVLHGNVAAIPTAEPGFTIITPGTNAVEYEIVNSTSTDSTVTFGDVAVGPWVSIGDTVQAGSTAPDFAILANPSKLVVLPTRSASSLLVLTSLNNFKGTVNLSLTPPPIGFSASVQPLILTLTANGTAQATLTVTSSFNVTAGFDLFVNGTSGTLSRSALVHVTETLVLPPSYQISAPSFLTVTAGNTIQVSVFVGSLNNFTGTVSLVVGVTPVFVNGPSISISPSQISVTPIISGFATLLITTNSNTVSGGFNYTISGTSIVGGGLLKEIFVGQLLVQPAPQPDFSLNAFPTFLLTSAGYSASSTIEVFPAGPFGGNLTVFLSAKIPSVNGLTAALSPPTVSFSPTTFGGTSTLTLNTLATTPPGNYTVTVTGEGGIYTHNVTLILRVLPPPPLVLSPTSGAVGSKVLVQGTGFPVPNGETELLVTFDDQLVGFVFTSTGNFSFTFDVPVAQIGTHLVKVSDQVYTTSLTIITASAGFQVIPNPIGLSVNLASGTLYFPGDSATFFVLVTQNGQPARISGLQLTVQIIKPNGSSQTLNMTSTATGVYTASYSISSTNSLGTYAVIVRAQTSTTGAASALTSFEVKPTWLATHGSTLVAGATVAGLVGLVGFAWQQGLFKKKRNDKSFNSNNWNDNPQES